MNWNRITLTGRTSTARSNDGVLVRAGVDHDSVAGLTGGKHFAVALADVFPVKSRRVADDLSDCSSTALPRTHWRVSTSRGRGR